MSKKVLILSGSPRKDGNSGILCDEFMKGAVENGNEVEKIRISEKKISPCIGCAITVPKTTVRAYTRTIWLKF